MSESIPGWKQIETPQGVLYSPEMLPKQRVKEAPRFAQVRIVEVVKIKRRGKRAKIQRLQVASFSKVSAAELAALRKYHRGTCNKIVVVK